jgi:hypothetical protein
LIYKAAVGGGAGIGGRWAVAKEPWLAITVTTKEKTRSGYQNYRRCKKITGLIEQVSMSVRVGLLMAAALRVPELIGVSFTRWLQYALAAPLHKQRIYPKPFF